MNASETADQVSLLSAPREPPSRASVERRSGSPSRRPAGCGGRRPADLIRAWQAECARTATQEATPTAHLMAGESVAVANVAATAAAAKSEKKSEALVPRAPADLNQPYFDAAEAAWLLRYQTVKAFYQAVHRYGIPHARKGQRVMLFKRADLEKFLASRTKGR